MLFVLLVFLPVLLQPGERCLGRPSSDARNQFYGWRAFGFGQVKAGRFPLWNPYELLGMPFVASLQSAMFYPTNWLCAVLPLGRAINISILVNLFLGGVFTYLWCRRLGVARCGAIVAAGTYVFGAPQFLRIFEGHWSFLCPMTWVPCVLLCIETILSNGAWALAIAGGSVAVCMQWFGGNPQYAMHGGIAAALYLALRLVSLRAQGFRFVLRSIAGFALMYLLGTVLAGVQFFPAAEMLAFSSRRGTLQYWWIAQYSFVPENFVSFLAPSFYGSDITQQYWGRWNLWETSPYVGIVALALAAAGILKGRRDIAWISAFGAVLFLCLALGPSTPLLKLCYRTLPGFDLFRAPGRFLAPFSLFVALLAGLGVQVFAEEWKDGRGRLLFALVVGIVAASLVTTGLFLLTDSDLARRVWVRFMDAILSIRPDQRLYLPEKTVTAQFKLDAMRESALALLGAGALLGGACAVLALLRRSEWAIRCAPWALVALAAVDDWTFARKYLVTFDPRDDGLTPGAIAYLKSVPQPFRFSRAGCFSFPTCEGMTHGFWSWEATQPHVPSRMRDIFWCLQGMRRHTETTNFANIAITPPLRMINLQYLIQYSSRPPVVMEGLRTVYKDAKIRIDALPDPWPRAWLVHEYVVVPNADEVLGALTRLNYEAAAIFEEDPKIPVAWPSAHEPHPEFVLYEPNRLKLKVIAAADAILVLSELYYPGWRATVDGRDTPVLLANYAMRAVAVPRGEHVVEFNYEPASFEAGLASSIAGLMGVGLLVMVHLRQRRKSTA